MKLYPTIPNRWVLVVDGQWVIRVTASTRQDAWDWIKRVHPNISSPYDSTPSLKGPRVYPVATPRNPSTPTE